MSITVTEGATIVEGPKGMALYRLMSLKSALGLESKGIKVARGVNARKIAKQETGLKTNDYTKLIEAVQAKIDVLNPQVPRVYE